MKIVKLIPSNFSKFHIGNSNGELKDYFSSDQLFSTIINNLDLLYGEEIVKKYIEHFEEDRLIISSVFYGLEFYHKNKKTSKEIYFLPKPYWLIRAENNEEKDISERKKIKKIEYISIKSYKSLMESWDEEQELFTYDLFNSSVMGNKFAISKEELNGLSIDNKEINKIKIYNTYSMPKVSVNRLYGDSNNFYFDDIMELKYTELKEYTVKPFMYFIYLGEMTKELKAAINIIQDEGIGGKRSRGLGSFQRVEFDELKDSLIEGINKDNNSNKYYTNISAIYPKIEEVDKIMSYKLENRRGFLFSDGGQAYRKKSVRIIKEGSIFKSRIKGKIKDITPIGFDKHHKVWLYGKALLIGFGGE